MLNFLFLIPAIPFAGFLVLALAGRRLSRSAAALAGTGSAGLSAVVSILAGMEFVTARPEIHAFIQTFWSWMEFDGYAPAVSFLLDPLSLIMVLVITLVGFLIHLYSAEFMAEEEGYSRFFASMNLFLSSMLTLVLADNLLLLYLGWEGVGLCSYLLIGFWYRDPANVVAARKAFVVTRVGDTAMAMGLFLLFTSLGTLDIREGMQIASKQWSEGSSLAVLASALLLGGAVGKSAQLPLQTWLPDAMAGPTPVSALIHAATMVTAGVYLIARMHVLFLLAPQVQFMVALIGAVTLLLAGFSALVQRDIKRVLAYSTISQTGYMFLALGAGAWSAALFHFMTHALFKALLFLAAGVVILAQQHEHDMFKMGGLRNRLPLTFWTFLIGAASLASLPLVTAGFYSKDMILWGTLSSGRDGGWLWLAGMAGALLTSVYAFRMVFVTFYGESRMEVGKKPGIRMALPLVALAVLSVVAGFIDLPEAIGDLHIFTDFLAPVFPFTHQFRGGARSELASLVAASLVSLAGIYLAYLFYLKRPELPAAVIRYPAADFLRRFWLSGWGFDKLYDTLVAGPFIRLSRLNRNDFMDSWYSAIAFVNRGLHDVLASTQTGKIRWYAMAMALGALVFLGIVLFAR